MGECLCLNVIIKVDEPRDTIAQQRRGYASMSGKIMKETAVSEAIPVHFSRKYNAEEISELVVEFKAALE